MRTRCLLLALVTAGWVLGGWVVTAQEYFDNVVVVLDASGSMKAFLSGTKISKMTAAKAALKAVMEQVPASTHIGVLVFSAANLKDDWAYPLGPRDDARLTEAIDRLQPEGATPLGRYLKVGADRLLTERAKQFGYGSYRLLVVTDGEAQDQNLVDRYTPEIMARGITVDVIGVAMAKDHTLATKAHSYRRANDADALRRAVREVFAEVGGKGGDTAQAVDFDALAPIPEPMAAALLQALSTSGNHPVGTTPKAAAPAPAPRTTPPAPADAGPPQAAAPASVPVPTATTPSPPPPPVSRQRKGMPVAVVIIIGMVLFSVLRRATRRSRR